MVEVTDADRVAAAEWDRKSWYHYEGDWLGDLTESFASHREQAVAEERALVVAMIAAQPHIVAVTMRIATAIERGEHVASASGDGG